MPVSPEQYQWYENHFYQSRQPSLYAAYIVGLVIAYVTVPTRWCARWMSGTEFGADDILITISLGPLTAYSISGIVSTRDVEDNHIIFVHYRRGFIETYITCIVAYAICTIFIKISILCFYCRIFLSRILSRVAWVLSIFIVAYNLALIFVAVFEYIPLSTMWTGGPGKCINSELAYVVIASINVATDVFILTIPIFYIASLQTSLKYKLKVCGLFLTGAIVCVFGIIRTVIIGIANTSNPSCSHKHQSRSGPPRSLFPNPSSQVYPGIISFCELFVGIVAASLPTMAILFTKSFWAEFVRSVRALLARCLARCTRRRERSVVLTGDGRRRREKLGST